MTDTDNSDSDSYSLANVEVQDLTGLSRVGVRLIDRIFDAAGHLWQPIHKVIMSKAEKKEREIQSRSLAERIEYFNDELGVDDKTALVLARTASEEEIKQENRDSVIGESVRFLNEDSSPEEIEDDWILNFLNECELTSDEELQQAWAKLLAGEANEPDSFSKRTVNVLSSLSRDNAQSFSRLSSFTLETLPNKQLKPIVPDFDNDILNKNGITLSVINELESLGLITCAKVGSITTRFDNSANIAFDYFGHKFLVRDINRVNYGKVGLTKTGKELMSVLERNKIQEFVDVAVEFFKSQTDESSLYHGRDLEINA